MRDIFRKDAELLKTRAQCRGAVFVKIEERYRGQIRHRVGGVASGANAVAAGHFRRVKRFVSSAIKLLQPEAVLGKLRNSRAERSMEIRTRWSFKIFGSPALEQPFQSLYSGFA